MSKYNNSKFKIPVAGTNNNKKLQVKQTGEIQKLISNNS